MTDTERNNMSVYTLYNTLFKYKQPFSMLVNFLLDGKKNKNFFFFTERYLILEQTTIRSVCLRTTFAHAGM